MDILMFSTDKKIFDTDSRVRDRQAEYGQLCDQLHIVIPAGKSHPTTDQLGENVWAHSVQHDNKVLAWFGIIRKTLNIIRKHNFNPSQSLITSQDPFEVGLAAWITSLWSDLPLNLQVHTDISSVYFRTQSFRRRFQVWLADFLLPRADTIRVVSKRVKDFIRSKFEIEESQTFTLPVYTDTAQVKKQSQTDEVHLPWEKTLVMVARLEPEKGVGFAIKALAPALRGAEDAGLLIVGDGSQKAELEKLITKLGIPHAVEFAGWQTNPLPYLKQAYLTVVPSYYEGWGMVPIESLLVGTPVIMTDVGAAGELVRDSVGGVVVPVNGKEKLRAEVVSFLSSTDKRAEYSQRTKRVTQEVRDRGMYLNDLQDIWKKTAQTS